MTPHEVQSYLDSFINHELNLKAVAYSSFKLKRMEYLLELLGRPEENIRFIHVAGTKGKGSTCVFAAHILKSAGYTTGLYTSPHIKDVKERIRVLAPGDYAQKENGEIFPDCIRDGELSSLLEKIKPDLEKARETPQHGRLTYFEVLTALAFCYFKERRVDFAVLETGLGGRLDATNVVDSLACGITPVSLEHTRQLGETLEEIAAEKAAIIKRTTRVKGIPPVVIVAPQSPGALEVIQTRCRQEGAKDYLVGRDIEFKLLYQDIDGQTFQVKGMNGVYDLKTHLLGACQAVNAATAVGLVESLAAYQIHIGGDAIQKGISETVWPGRFEILRRRPYVILDSAHNPASSKEAAETVQGVFPRKKIILILGISDDKDKIGICRNFDAISKEVILTRAAHPRACCFTGKDMAGVFKTKNCVRTDNVREAMDAALTRAGQEDVVLVTGSVFVVSEARELCIN